MIVIRTFGGTLLDGPVIHHEASEVWGTTDS
jgi:hypothetical protein